MSLRHSNSLRPGLLGARGTFRGRCAAAAPVAFRDVAGAAGDAPGPHSPAAVRGRKRADGCTRKLCGEGGSGADAIEELCVGSTEAEERSRGGHI
eukprot:gene11840-40307_t